MALQDLIMPRKSTMFMNTMEISMQAAHVAWSYFAGPLSGFNPLKIWSTWSAAGLPSLLNNSKVTFLAAGFVRAATQTRATSDLAILPALPLSP